MVINSIIYFVAKSENTQNNEAPPQLEESKENKESQ